MAKKERLELITQIQEKRGSHLISYVTGTRPGAEVQMAMDSIRKVYDHIISAKKKKEELSIDLFLYSNGGDGTVPWRLVTLIREYANKFTVIIPFRAFSAATLTSLGADEIIMHPMGMLGPTDPTVSNDFNPPNATNPQQKIGISVEDVSAYINLIKEDAGITHEDELVQAFNKLPDNIHPLALGNVKRSLSQSRMMANKLLSLHMTDAKDQHQIEEIVDNLTSKLYYHGHPINRIEAAKNVGIRTVKNPDAELEDLVWKLYLDYEKDMELEVPFNPVFEFIKKFPSTKPGQVEKTAIAKAKLVYIESCFRSDVNVLHYQILGADQNGIINTQLLTLNQGWETE
jgi:hypothetical protein